jgi:hypothetical protein
LLLQPRRVHVIGAGCVQVHVRAGGHLPQLQLTLWPLLLLLLLLLVLLVLLLLLLLLMLLLQRLLLRVLLALPWLRWWGCRRHGRVLAKVFR